MTGWMSKLSHLETRIVIHNCVTTLIRLLSNLAENRRAALLRLLRDKEAHAWSRITGPERAPPKTRSDWAARISGAARMRLRLELDRLGSSRGSKERSFLATGSGVAAGSLAFAGKAESHQVQLIHLGP